ncbi:hypothetical protein L3X38_025907 [Prunus dulcis]|uniref:Uncharacterized protein n=1 Tax=Prunus dulcis TaxID=3755 RepID=A0AAD4W3Q4_PRUDU|nr:hypothetical protein L3X38_025907 [Prunus dulcis]
MHLALFSLNAYSDADYAGNPDDCRSTGAYCVYFVFHSRNHHVEVDYHFVHERVVRNGLLVANCSTIDQITDIFNRGLSPARFSLLLSKLPVLHLPISLRGCNGLES